MVVANRATEDTFLSHKRIRIRNFHIPVVFTFLRLKKCHGSLYLPLLFSSKQESVIYMSFESIFTFLRLKKSTLDSFIKHS